ncbi:hypothetical protein MELE44368_17610 [Mycolicibacterium elephantis DSM 44368]|uniref:Uncharacterized protein n=1 Tax=Mycolicibacterium elephantis DSM 44368 TaxID=1335622 RepID=A0A439DUS8_9MYCO|nr:hypothetical protein MELE44368_17610 [Mycolicibacterium elephantis DSM 44368]
MRERAADTAAQLRTAISADETHPALLTSILELTG